LESAAAKRSLALPKIKFPAKTIDDAEAVKSQGVREPDAEQNEVCDGKGPRLFDARTAVGVAARGQGELCWVGVD